MILPRRGAVAGADAVGDLRRGQQHLRGQRDAAVERGHELLHDDAPQRRGQLEPGLRLLVGREDVDDALDRLDGVDGAQRGQDELARLGGRERQPDRLDVGQLAHDEHVRVLAQGVAQAPLEGRGVLADLSLVHDRPPVLVQELDRLLDGEDVARPGPVDPVDERRQRRRGARAVRPAHEHEALAVVGPLDDVVREAEVLRRRDVGRDEAEHGTHRVALHEGGHPEPALARDGVGGGVLAGLEEPLALALGEHARARGGGRPSR